MLTAYHYWLFDFRSDAVGDARLTRTDLSVNSCNIGQVWTTQVLTTELDNLPGWSPDGSGIVFTLNADGSGKRMITDSPWAESMPLSIPAAR